MSNGAANLSSMTTPNGGFTPGRMLAALILGASSPWVGGPISVLAGYIVLPLMQDLLQASAGLGLPDETKRFAVLAGANLLWSLAFGFVFGVPLGYFVAGRIWLYWAVFVAGAVVTGLLGSLIGRYGISTYLLNWTYPAEWLDLFAVAGFAYIGVFFRHRVERQDNAARYRQVFAVISALLIASIAGVGWYLIESSG